MIKPASFWMIISRGLLPLSLMVIATASNADIGSNIPTMQKFLFHVSRENYAWGRVIKGLYVDSQGKVYEYDHSDADWRQSDENGYSELELSDLFKNKHLKTTVDATTLSRMYKLIKLANAGKLTPPAHRCADFGTITYVAYSFAQEKQLYKPVLLYRVGDVAYKNQSESAKTLYEWLFSLSGGRPESCLP